LLRELPRRARYYIVTVIVAGFATLAVFLPRADLSAAVSITLFVFLSSLTSAFKVQFPIASGSNMSVSYVVDILALILLGPHPTMIVGGGGCADGRRR
jgi:hypothetical protein